MVPGTTGRKKINILWMMEGTRMKLRKLAALTMAGVLAAAGLSACGGGSAPDTGAAAEAREDNE